MNECVAAHAVHNVLFFGNFLNPSQYLIPLYPQTFKLEEKFCEGWNFQNKNVVLEMKWYDLIHP